MSVKLNVTILKNGLGKTKLKKLELLEIQFKRLGKPFDWFELSKLSQNELDRLKRQCFAESGNGGYYKKTGIDPTRVPMI